ncbi:MAG: bacillithiol biosynthesis cysteine-adding enzyme BshC [bacterium]|nr:bacillithiol biosynthesis cysteine-adding enzyme BshC [bacterium]
MGVSWESVDLSCPEPLYDSYLRHSTSLAARFDGDPLDPGWPSRRLTYLAGRSFSREDLAQAIAAYNRRAGAGPLAVANALSLREPGTAVVVGGQQAGLLTGPLYTIHKAANVIQLARELGRRLGIVVVPCFWVAAEDHDLAEVDHIWVPGDGGLPVRFGLDMPRRCRLPVGEIALGSSASPILDQLGEVIPRSEHRRAILAKLRDLAQGATSLADWFARIMAWLFAPWGLVLVDPADRALRAVAGPFLGRLVEGAPDLAGAVEEGTRAVEGLGFEPQFRPRRGRAHLFLAGPGGERLPLQLDSQGGFRVGAGRARTHLDRAQAVNLAQAEPWRLSANVVSRPLIQEAILPVLAQVVGPGETGYYAQLREAFSLFGFALPVLWPRLSLTLADGPVRRLMTRYRVRLERGQPGLQEERERVLASLDRTGFEAAFDAARAEIGRRYDLITRAVVPLDPAMEQLTGVNRHRVLGELAYLHERARRAHRERQRVVVGHFARLEGHLFPRGQWQERVLNVVPWLCRYGHTLITWIVESPLVTDHRHRLLLF